MTFTWTSISNNTFQNTLPENNPIQVDCWLQTPGHSKSNVKHRLSGLSSSCLSPPTPNVIFIFLPYVHGFVNTGTLLCCRPGWVFPIGAAVPSPTLIQSLDQSSGPMCWASSRCSLGNGLLHRVWWAAQLSRRMDTHTATHKLSNWQTHIDKLAQTHI